MRGEDMDINRIHLASMHGSYTYQSDITAVYKVSDKKGYFSYNYFVTGEDDKAVFSIPGNTSILSTVPDATL
jgi:hypothetical protein